MKWEFWKNLVFQVLTFSRNRTFVPSEFVLFLKVLEYFNFFHFCIKVSTAIIDCLCYRRLMPIDQAFKNPTIIACTVLVTLAAFVAITTMALIVIRNRSKLFQLVRSVSSSTTPSDDGSTSVESAYGSSVRTITQ